MRSSLGGVTALRQALDVLARRHVEVGIFGDKSARTKDGKSNAEIGFKHEYGVGKLPQRSFLRMPINYRRAQIFQEARLGPSSIQTPAAATTFLQRVGAAAHNAVMEAFATGGWGTWPPNAYATVLRKLRRSIKSLAKRKAIIGQVYAGQGGDTVLIDTGQLRRAVAWRVA